MRQRVVLLVVAVAVVHVVLAYGRWHAWFAPPIGMIIAMSTAWVAILFLAALASRQITGLQTDLRSQQDRHQASLNQIEQLATLNEMLLTLGRSNDVGLAFQALTSHMGRLVPCDQLGLALLRESGQELLT